MEDMAPQPSDPLATQAEVDIREFFATCCSDEPWQRLLPEHYRAIAEIYFVLVKSTAVQLDASYAAGSRDVAAAMVAHTLSRVLDRTGISVVIVVDCCDYWHELLSTFVCPWRIQVCSGSQTVIPTTNVLVTTPSWLVKQEILRAKLAVIDSNLAGAEQHLHMEQCLLVGSHSLPGLDPTVVVIDAPEQKLEFIPRHTRCQPWGVELLLQQLATLNAEDAIFSSVAKCVAVNDWPGAFALIGAEAPPQELNTGAQLSDALVKKLQIFCYQRVLFGTTKDITETAEPTSREERSLARQVRLDDKDRVSRAITTYETAANTLYMTSVRCCRCNKLFTPRASFTLECGHLYCVSCLVTHFCVVGVPTDEERGKLTLTKWRSRRFYHRFECMQLRRQCYDQLVATSDPALRCYATGCVFEPNREFFCDYLEKGTHVGHVPALTVSVNGWETFDERLRMFHSFRRGRGDVTLWCVPGAASRARLLTLLLQDGIRAVTLPSGRAARRQLVTQLQLGHFSVVVCPSNGRNLPITMHGIEECCYSVCVFEQDCTPWLKQACMNLLLQWRQRRNVHFNIWGR